MVSDGGGFADCWTGGETGGESGGDLGGDSSSSTGNLDFVSQWQVGCLIWYWALSSSNNGPLNLYQDMSKEPSFTPILHSEYGVGIFCYTEYWGTPYYWEQKNEKK
ncbi:transducin/WD40 repeat-like superfamily protein [Striga asiatica]|uniref:Transducin/WD40 repeat-like superfamily protein n=1 Tax=Striga asiatica TaxID=4170 RepID=A0A5A7Q8T6_STRAF|nr:transducin/WD40 repeat-like superfamily protein [Striga asiatica]